MSGPLHRGPADFEPATDDLVLTAEDTGPVVGQAASSINPVIPVAGVALAALALFLVQLALNSLWSWLFFGWHRGALAFADILLLWVLIVATLIGFWHIRPLAGVLMIPYLLWVGFASALNYFVWQLNPQVLG